MRSCGCHIALEFLGIRPDTIEKCSRNPLVDGYIEFLQVLGKDACSCTNTRANVDERALRCHVPAILVMVDDNIDLRLRGNVIIRARSRTVDKSKIGAFLERLCSHMLHFDVEQVDKRPVLLVADAAFVEDPCCEGFRIGMFCNLGKGHSRRDRIRIRILVGDDSQCALPAGKEGKEPLGYPARMLLFDLEDRRPCNHFLGIEHKFRPGSSELLPVHRIDRTCDYLDSRVTFLDGEDCSKVGIAIYRS